MENTFKNLAREINYQENYSYEERVDIFNKYNISTSTNFINPIMLLAHHLTYRGSWGGTVNYYGVSHSGAIMSNFNKDISKNKSRYVVYSVHGNHSRYQVFFGLTKAQFKRHVTFYVWNDDTIKIRLWETSFMVTNNPKTNFDYYKETLQFIKDFKIS